ncbi:MAG: hypothetical protein IPO73_08850, partial [Gemmatimonadetes bacterium]|nr:hypothetical protein [Gemmatimonadota bacterium]
SLDIAPAAVTRCLVEQSATLRHPPRSVGDVLGTLQDLGMVRTAARFREFL